MKNETILIVEDEMIISATIEETLNKIGYNNIETAFTANKAKELMRIKDYDIILMDVKLGPGEDGIDVVTEIRRKKDIHVIYVTGNSDDITVKKAKTTLPSGFITKPISESDLRIQLELILYKEKFLQAGSEEAMQHTNLYEGDCSGLSITLNLEGNILGISPIIKKLTGRPAHEYLNKKIGTARFERDMYELLNKLIYKTRYTKERAFHGNIYSPYIGQRVFTIEAITNGFYSFEFMFTDITEGLYISSYGSAYCEVALASQNTDQIKALKQNIEPLKKIRIAAELRDSLALKMFLKSTKSVVLLLDIALEGFFELLTGAQHNSDIKKIILASTGYESSLLHQIDKNLYHASVSKTASPAILIQSIEMVKSGQKYDDPSLSANS